MLLMLGLNGCEQSATAPDPFVAEKPEVVTVQHPQVALDGNGFATITHNEQSQRGNAYQTSVKASRYSFSDGLFVDEVTQADYAEKADDNRALASDQSGLVIQFFRRFLSPTNCLFVPGLSWSCATFPFIPDALAMDGAGRALAIRQSGVALLGNHFISGIGWRADQSLTVDFSQPGGTIPRDTLVYWNGGVGYAVWADSQQNVRASRFLRSTETWEASQVLGTIKPGVSPHVALARNAVNSGALVVWEGVTGGVQGVLEYSRYIPGTGWQAAQSIPNVGRFLQMAMANNGDAMLVGDGGVVVLAVRFSNGIWGAVQTIGALPNSKPRIVMDGSGNAMALFVDNSRNLIANRFSLTSGWQGGQSIGTLIDQGSGLENDDLFDVDMDEAGRAMIVWAGEAGPAFPPGSSRLRTYVSGGFTVSLTPSILPLQRNGDSQLATVSITRLGYTGPVDLQHFDCPAKVICVFDRSQIPGNENTAGLTFLTNLNDPALAGNYVVRVTGTGGGATTEAFIEVQIQ